MKFRFGKEDIFLVFLNLLVLGFGIYYCRKLIQEDFKGIFWLVLAISGGIIILSDVFVLIYSGKVLFILFIAFIGLTIQNAYKLNEADNKLMDNIYLEIATAGPPFSEFLSDEQSRKGSKYGSHNSWVYKRIRDNEFTIYRLDKLNLLRRDYPDNKNGWYTVLNNDIVPKILLNRKLSESEKEQEVARVLSEMGLSDFPQY